MYPGVEPDPASPSRKPRRFRLRRARLALALVVVAGVVGTGVVLLRLEGWTRALIERELGRALDAEVRVGRVDLDLWRLRVEFADLFAETGTGPDAAMRLSIPRGAVGLAWQQLSDVIAGRLHLTEVYLERPLVALVAAEGRGEPAGEALQIDLRIDRLRVDDGRIAYRDREIPLSLEAEKVGLTGAWSGDRRAMVGRFRLNYRVLVEPLELPLELSVASGFRWRGSRVELFELGGEADGMRVGLDGELSWAGDVAWSAEGRLDFDLGPLGRLLEPDLPSIGATGSADLILKGRGPAWEAEGAFEAADARWDRFRASLVRGRYRLEPGRLALDVAEAMMFGGKVTGTVGFELGDEARFVADLTAGSLRTRPLFAALDLPLPLDARSSARLRLEGAPDRMAGWTGNGSFSARAEPSEDGVPFASRGEVRLEEGRLRVTADAVEAGAAEFTLGLATELGRSSAPVALSVEGRTADASATQRSVLRILEALSTGTPELLGRPLHGSGRFRSRIEIDARDWVALELELAQGAWDDLSFDELGLALTWDGAELVLDRLGLSRGTERLEGSARLIVEPLRFRELAVEADGVALRPLLTLLGTDFDLEGALSGRLELAAGDGGPAGGGRVSLVAGSGFGEPFDRADARVEVSAGIWRLRELAVRGPAIEAEGELAWHVDASTADLELRRGVVDVAGLGLTLRERLPLGGLLELAGRLAFEPEGTRGELTLTAREFAVDRYGVGPFAGSVRIGPGGVGLSLGGEGWQGEIEVQPVGDWPVAAELRFDGYETELGQAGRDVIWVAGSGEATITGPMMRPAELAVDGGFENLTVGVGARRFSASRVPVRLASSVLEVGPIRLRGPSGEVEGRIRYELEDGGVEGDCAGYFDLGLLAVLLPEARGSGRLAVDLGLTGTLEEPELAGSIRLAGGRLRRLGFPQVLEQVEAQAVFSGTRVEIRGFRAVTGGGELQGEGELIADLKGVRSHRVELVGKGIRVPWPAGFDGVYDTRITWAGTPDESTIRGELFLLRGLYTNELEVGGFLGPAGREYGTEEAQTLPENVLLDLDLTAEGNVWVRNELVESEARVDLKIGGDLRRPELIGRISLLEDGKIRYRHVEYRILSATVEFTDPQRIRPFVSLSAETMVGQYEIRLRVEGYPERFEYDLTSTPTLSQQDIIALLATGRTLEEISGQGGAGFTGDLATNYFAGALTGKFERQLQNLLKLERFTIDPLLYEGRADPTTRITVGKEVAEDLMVVVSSDLGANERQLYQIEWRASPKIRLTTQRDTTGGLGADLFYTGRIAGRRPPPTAPPSMELSEGGVETQPAGEKVAGVRLEGVSPESADAVRRRLRLAPGDRFRRSLLFEGVEAIRRFYVERDRLQVEVRTGTEPAPLPSEGIDVVYSVAPGPRFRVVLDGATKKEQRQIRGRLRTLWTRQLFGEDLYTDSVAEIEKFYRQRGFYAVDVHHEVEREEDGFLLAFEIDRGKPVRVTSVDIEGAVQVPAERIRRQILTRSASLFSRRTLDTELLEQDLRAVRNLYRDLGFLRAKVAGPQIRLSSSADSAEITIRIDEGPRFTIADVRFAEIADFPAEELLSWTGLERGQSFSASGLLEAESAIRAAADRLGYPDARVRSGVTLGEETVDIEFTLSPGGVKYVDEIVLAGNERTRDRIIRRELAFKAGEPISRAKILETQHRLYRLNIFSNVRITYGPVEGRDPALQRVEIHVEEAPPLSLTVGVGYDSEAKGRASFALSHDNLGGADREARFEAQASGILKRVQLLGREPTVFGSRLPGTATLFWEDREETGFSVERTLAALRVDREITPKWKGFARYSFQTVDVTDVTDPAALQGERLENVELGDFGITLVRDTRDDPLSATRGSFFSINGRVFAKPLLSESSFVKTTLTWGKVLSLPRRTVYASAVRLGVASPFGSTDEVPISERFFAGGDSTLRGFGRNEVGPMDNDVPIGGETTFLVNQEFRYPIWGQLRGVVFYDAGNVYQRVSDTDLTDLRHVLGLGVRLETPIGPVRLEYGRKLDREPDESRGELFLAIGTIF